MGNQQSGRGLSGVVGSGTYVGRTKWARAFYDFATDGGAVGAKNLRGDALPSGAVVVSSYVKVETAVTSGGAATVSLGIQTAVDVRAVATDLTTAPSLATTGVKQGLITNAVSALLTADRHIVATVATAALTAGRFSVFVEYVELSASV